MVGQTKKIKKVTKKKVAGAPSAIFGRGPKSAPKNDPLITKRPRNYGIGQDIQHKRDVTRFVKWPKYVRIQRQRTILYNRIKVPPPINQFRACCLDRQNCTQLFKLLDKYKMESDKAKSQRLKAIAKDKAEGKEVAPAKRPNRVVLGINKITSLVEQKKATLVVIASDVDPIEVVLHLPALCRKMGVAYCVVKGGRSRLGMVARRKSVAALALTTVNSEDKSALSKLCESVKASFNERYEEIRKQWGGNNLSNRSKAKIAKLEKAKEKEIAA